MNAEPQSERATASEKDSWVPIVVVTVVAFAIRLIYVLWAHPVGDYLYSDMRVASRVAERFADPDHVLGQWDTVKPRALGFVGGWMLRLFEPDGLQWWGGLQAILSTVTVPLAYLGSRRFFGHRAALLGAAFLSVDYLAFGLAGLLMAETYLMFCLALSFALLDPQRPFRCLLSGLALGIGALFKPQALPLLPLWCLLLFFWPQEALLGGISGPAEPTADVKRPRGFARIVTLPRVGAVLLLFGAVAPLLPETLAVSQIMGKPTFLTAYGGQNFYIGHCHVRDLRMDGGGGYFTSCAPKVIERNLPWPDVTFKVGVFDSGFFIQEGMKCVRESIGADLLWAGKQLLDVFAGWPGSTINPWPLRGGWTSATRIWSLLIEYLIAPLAFYDLWRRRRLPGSWLGFAAPMAAVWSLALLFAGDPRYREPFDLFLFAAGASGLQLAWAAFSGRSWAARRASGPVSVGARP